MSDETILIDDVELRQALVETLPGIVREVANATALRLTRSALDRLRGRIVDPADVALLDGDSQRVRRAETGAALRRTVRDEVRRELARRGRS